jgi:UDP-N-acetylglucosamine acyltransferase
MEIHPSAVIHPAAELDSGVKVGAYVTIGERVSVGRDTEIGGHVVLEGRTQIGERNRIYPFCTIGTPPQDVGYKGEDTRLVIGNDNIIREYVTANRATTKEHWETVVGDGNYIMAYAHIAHDCRLGNGVVMANVATLGGHVKIGDYASLGGLVAVHQFVRIGDYAFVGGKTAVVKDVPPFMMVSGSRAKLYGINQKGLKRSGFSQDKIEGLKKAYRMIWREGQRFQDAVKSAREQITPFPELEMLLNFLDGGKRGITR